MSCKKGRKKQDNVIVSLLTLLKNWTVLLTSSKKNSMKIQQTINKSWGTRLNP